MALLEDRVTKSKLEQQKSGTDVLVENMTL